MELKQFAEELRIRMNAELDAISADQADPLLRTLQLIVCIEKNIQELKKFAVKYKFRSADEEIEFFKTIKPAFVAHLWYYRKLFKVQLFESYNSQDSKLKYFRKRLLRLEVYIQSQQEFYRYMLAQRTSMDDKYFTRNGTDHDLSFLDNRFSTSHDIRHSKILAYEQLKIYLLKAIQKIETPSVFPGISGLTWTGSKTDLIELIYALQSAGVFNKKEADVKQVATYFENTFNISLGNYYRIFQDIRLRKTGQTNFINQLRENLLSRIREVEK